MGYTRDRIKYLDCAKKSKLWKNIWTWTANPILFAHDPALWFRSIQCSQRKIRAKRNWLERSIFCICCCVAAKKLLYLSWQCLDSSAAEVLSRNCQLGPHEKMYHLLLIYRDHSAKKKISWHRQATFVFMKHLILILDVVRT